MPDKLIHRPELRALRRRAYEELNLAVDQSGGELPSDWLRQGDRDLTSLRNLGEPEWLLLVRRQTGESRPEDPQFPAAAWGDPHRRRGEWLGVSVLLAAIAVTIVIAFLPNEALLAFAGLAALVGVALIWTLTRHRGRILTAVALVVGGIYGLTQAPEWVPAALALLLGSAGALLMAQRAGSKADEADKKSIALWNAHHGETRDSKTASPTQPEGNKTIPRRDGQGPPEIG